MRTTLFLLPALSPSSPSRNVPPASRAQSPAACEQSATNARRAWTRKHPLSHALSLGLLATACSFSTYGLPGGEEDSTTTTDTSTSTSSGSSTQDPSTGPAATSTGTTGLMAACGNGEVEAGEECDDNNLQDTDGCSSSCTREYRRVFVTSQGFTGDLGGIDGADQKCEDAAKLLDPPGVFRAWISAGADSPATTFVRSTVPYVDLDMTPIAANWDELTDGMLASGIARTETGAAVPESACLQGFSVAWTSTTTAGAKANPGADCNGWTSTASQGDVGQVGFATEDWTEAQAALSCTCLASLYCVEQSSASTRACPASSPTTTIRPVASIATPEAWPAALS